MVVSFVSNIQRTIMLGNEYVVAIACKSWALTIEYVIVIACKSWVLTIEYVVAVTCNPGLAFTISW
jgi:hypothetical protein